MIIDDRRDEGGEVYFRQTRRMKCTFSFLASLGFDKFLARFRAQSGAFERVT